MLGTSISLSWALLLIISDLQELLAHRLSLRTKNRVDSEEVAGMHRRLTNDHEILTIFPNKVCWTCSKIDFSFPCSFSLSWFSQEQRYQIEWLYWDTGTTNGYLRKIDILCRQLMKLAPIWHWGGKGEGRKSITSLFVSGLAQRSHLENTLCGKSSQVMG